MDRGGRVELSDRRGRALGVGLILVTAGAMAVVELRHLTEMTTVLGVFAFAFLPFVVNLGIIGIGYAIWTSSYDGPEVLRITGWMFVGMAAIGLVAVWTITTRTSGGSRSPTGSS